ncbi:ABC transporter substrate-binding protein [Ruegeria sp.]|uniref:ABC transporter substrate-binding protein n=1 Tax=Ruegeria sp. TaxID=1879320 RepID=UPI003C7E5223
MKKLMLSTVLICGAVAASAEDIKVGLLLSFTGPIESLVPPMADSSELAFSEVNAAGGLFDGDMISVHRGDATCVDAGAAVAAAERLITSDGVVTILGADCSGVTGAVLANVAVPNKIPLVSPSASSPALSTAEDDGLFFRTATSDARQGEVLAELLVEKGIKNVAVTYTNNDYGKGLSNSFVSAFTSQGGEITLNASHEDGKPDYSAEVGALFSAGGELLVVLGYADQGGRGIIQAALDAGAFDTFLLGEAMYGDSLISEFGDGLDGSFGAVPWTHGEGADAFAALAEAANVDGSASYTRESYDAAALIALAIQAAGETSPEAIKESMWKVANGPGEPILPGELAKGIEILKNGGEVDYVGATNIELIGPGEVSGTFLHYTINGGDYEQVDIR